MGRRWPCGWLLVLACWSPMAAPGVVSGQETGLAGQETGLVLAPGGDGVQRGTVILESYAFIPNRLSVQAGAPVELRLDNRSFLTPHNFIIEHADGTWRHEQNVSAGSSVTMHLRLDRPGTYVVYCDKQLLFFAGHRAKGMEGRLDVRREGSNAFP